MHVDKGYRGHNHPNKFKVWISGQVRRVTKAIRREMKRRAAIEPVIGHIKAEHRMGRNHLKGRDGDRANALLAAAGYNFSLLLRWFEALWRALIAALWRPVPQTSFGQISDPQGSSRTTNLRSAESWHDPAACWECSNCCWTGIAGEAATPARS